MEWNPNKWSKRTKIIWMILVFLVAFFHSVNRAHAEETVGQHIKEAVYDVMSASIAVAGAAQSTATGNFVIGFMCVAVAGHEIGEAYYELKSAWDLYRSDDYESYLDRDISPNEANFEHGRD
jgi:hypothetical protein